MILNLMRSHVRDKPVPTDWARLAATSYNLKIGVAISTFTEAETETRRIEIIEESLDSLTIVTQQNRSRIELYIVVVVDGPVPQRHEQLLKKYDFQIFQKTRNRGVACAKNTGIRLLLEQGVDIGFLMDDDVLYMNDCFEAYINCILPAKLHHMMFCYLDPLVHPESEWDRMGYKQDCVGGIGVMRHSGRGVGCLLTFTPELIQNIGYFPMLPGKYGYEHINFTRRCTHHRMIPFPSDIPGSENYIKHLGFEPEAYHKYRKYHSIPEKRRLKESKKNSKAWSRNLPKYVKLVE